MLNLTLLSLSITSDFQKSPFLLLSSSTKPSLCIFKSINAKQLFSSFLTTQSFNSFSIIECSMFNRFITALPILCFKMKETKTRISNETFYGDTIPSKNNKFYRTNYTEIINCKFMSITDNNDEQSLVDGGLCIYTTKSTKVESCYFYAILSRRSGSAVLFNEEEEHVESVVVNCIFKSISQTCDRFDFLTGGVISHGKIVEEDNIIVRQYISSSLTESCCFNNARLTCDIYAGEHFGVVTYISVSVKSKNLNFTDNKMDEYMYQYGIISYFGSITSENSFSFINIFNCIYAMFGSFSLINPDSVKQEFFLSYTNFINNSHQYYMYTPQFGIMYWRSSETFLKFSNIQSNSKMSFIGLFIFEEDDINIKPIDLMISNSLFGCSFDSLISSSRVIVLNQYSENNIFDYSDFNVDVTNNIISNFGYIRTSQFSASNTFSNSFILNSASYFDLNEIEFISRAIEIISYGIGVITFIGFFMFFCCCERKRQIDIDQFFQLNFVNEMEDLSTIEITNENERKHFEIPESKNENIISKDCNEKEVGIDSAKNEQLEKSDNEI